jgi:hypothetical protein
MRSGNREWSRRHAAAPPDQTPDIQCFVRCTPSQLERSSVIAELLDLLLRTSSQSPHDASKLPGCRDTIYAQQGKYDLFLSLHQSTVNWSSGALAFSPWRSQHSEDSRGAGGANHTSYQISGVDAICPFLRCQDSEFSASPKTKA